MELRGTARRYLRQAEHTGTQRRLRKKKIKINAGMLKQYGLNAKGGVVYEDVEVGVCRENE